MVSGVRVKPETPQTAGVSDVKMWGRPEFTEAATPNDPCSISRLATGGKVTVCKASCPTWVGTTFMNPPVPSPSAPFAAYPQQRAVSSSRAAQACPRPAATWVTPDVSPYTSTGKGRLRRVPSPREPSLFAPQHFTPPPLVSAQ